MKNWVVEGIASDVNDFKSSGRQSSDSHQPVFRQSSKRVRNLLVVFQSVVDYLVAGQSLNCHKSVRFVIYCALKTKRLFSLVQKYTPPRTPRISGLKSQILKPTFLS